MRWWVCVLLSVGCTAGPRDPFEGTGTTGSPTPTTTTTDDPAHSTGAASTTEDSGTFDVGHGGDIPGGGPGTVDCDELDDNNLGCEFWAVDLPNVSVAPLEVTPQDQQFAVVVANAAAGLDAHVEIFSGAGMAPINSATVPDGGVHTFTLPAQSIAPAVTSAEGVAYRIESDVPITAYQFQPLDNTNPVYSNDATILFPTRVLTGNYTAITADATITATDGFGVSNDNTGGFVSIVAVEDGTNVDVFPTQALYPGNHQGVTLDRGQVLTAIASELREAGNLSGTRVEADKPVAVFAGSVATAEPTEADNCCADHVEHQMLPLEAWGTAYAAPPVPAAMGGADHPRVVRVTGAYDGTALAYDPPVAGAPDAIGAYETVAFVTAEAFTVRSMGDEPFAVAQFPLSNQNHGVLLYPGDPSMLVLPADDQFADEYVFLVPMGYAQNYVTVVAPQASTVTLDGAELVPSWTAFGAAYKYAHVSLAPGRHHITADDPISISVFGYAQDVSFGYTGGSGVAQISEPPPPEG